MEACGQIASARLDVVVAFTAILDPGFIDEVEVGLPHLAVVLDVVSKGGALDKGVITLVSRQVGGDLG